MNQRRRTTHTRFTLALLLLVIAWIMAHAAAAGIGHPVIVALVSGALGIGGISIWWRDRD